MGQKLRSGYTTGTCASAAAKAAAMFLMEGKVSEQVKVCLGNGTWAEFVPESVKTGESILEGDGWWRVKKDAGDDPDVTDGAWIYGRVLPVKEQHWERLCLEGKGYLLEEYPGIYLNGGPGIGIAAKEGLPCLKGHYAINPVPCRMILQAVEEVRRKTGYEGLLEVQTAVPDGIALAEKTFNPRLGIVGGISLLGTTGIVEPMSEKALLETIRLDIRVKAAEGRERILMAPGNYGEEFLRQKMGIPLGEAVKCSNFIADSVVMAAEEGVRRILLAGHIGKLVKAAGGVRNTHSRYGDRRMEIMVRLAREVLEGREETKTGLKNPQAKACLLEAVGKANTTEEAVGKLREAGIAELVLACAAKHVKEQIFLWTKGRIEAEVIVFSQAHGLIGRAAGSQPIGFGK